jgi:hypothetical protein
LSFFDDGNLRVLSAPLKERLATAVRPVDLDLLPEIDGFPHELVENDLEIEQ